MHHYFEAITNNKGDALTGYYVRLVDSGGSGVTLYADTSLTPIVSVSGVADAARVDADGNVDFYVATGTYTLNIYATDSTTLIRSVLNVGMNIDMNTAATAVAAQASASASATAAAGSATSAATAATSAAGYFASLASTTTDALNRMAASRGALAALATDRPVLLTETRREGMFVFRSTDHTAKVTADTQQGIYVAPVSDATGASGAWVRQFSGPIDIRWFGAVGDCSVYGAGTDNSPAINGAKATAKLLGNGAAILIPKSTGLYRCASSINFTEHVQLLGQGHGQNPGNVGGATYTAPSNYRGSVLVFDADVPGLIFTAFTDNAANATAFEYESSGKSVIRDLMVIGGGGVLTTAHGVDSHVGLRCDNLRVTGFAGNGLNIVANTSGATQYGNADESYFSGCLIDANKLHGVKLDGNDANNITFTACSFTNNGGCGTLDFTTVGGNLFLGCQYATNNRSHPTNSASGYSAAQIALVQAEAPCLTDNLTGSAVMYRSKDYSGSDIGNDSGYFICYVEIGTGSLARLRGNTKVSGGFLAQTNTRHSEYNADTWGVANDLKGVKDFYGTGSAFTFYDLPMSVKNTSGTTIPYIEIVPFGSTYSQFKMKGLSGSATAGLDVLAGNNLSAWSCDSFTFRNAAQSTTFLTSSATGVLASVPLGYLTGAGGAVTQLTSRTTGVTLNNVCGAITLFSAAGSASWQTFTVTNSKVAATDVIRLNQKSGTDLYQYMVTNVAAGSFKVSFATTGGTTTEQPVFSFAVIKAVAS